MAQDRLAIESSFARGIVRDVPRHIIPDGGSYDLLDFLIDQSGKIYKRGGTSYQSAALAGEDDLIGIAAPEFPGDPRVVAFASDGANTTLYDITTDTPAAGQDCNSALLLENPPLFVDRLILCDGSGTIGDSPHAPQKAYLDTAVVVVADLAGLPPTAAYSCVHNGRVMMANSVAHPNRVWYGPPLDLEPTRFTIATATAGAAGAGSFTVTGALTVDFVVGAHFNVDASSGNNGTYQVKTISFNGTTTTIVPVQAVPDGTDDGNLGICWDTFESYIDVGDAVTGLASVQGVLLVFSRGRYWRILGLIPPGYGVPDSLVDTELQPASTTGCIDARSLAYDGNVVFVANETGVFAVTGAGDQSLTTKPGEDGIAALWQDTIRDFAPALGSVVAAGVIRDHLFVSVRRRFEDADPQRDQFLCFIPAQAWMRLSDDCGANMYATRFAPVSALYSAVSSESDNRARNLTGIFSPDADNKQDANGDDVEPLWESRTQGLTLGVQRRHYYDFGDKHYDLGQVSYVLTDAATDAPTLALTEATGLEATNPFAAVPESPLAAVAALTRTRFAMGQTSTGLTLKLEQTGPSAATELHMIEMTVRSLDPGGGGD